MFVKQSTFDKVVQERDALQQNHDTVVAERDVALQSVNTVTAERDALQQQLDAGNGSANDDAATTTMNETFTALDALDESVQSAETPAEKTTAVVNLVAGLRKSPGAKPAKVVSKTEAPAAPAQKDENIVKDNNSFMENLAAVKELI